MKKVNKIIVLMLIILLFVFSANMCFAGSYSKLIGTWSVTYSIVSAEFTDIFYIQSVAANGEIFGEDEYGDPIHGYASKNYAFVSEVGGDIYLDNWYFQYKGGKYAVHMGIRSEYNQFDTSYHRPANAKKVSKYYYIYNNISSSQYLNKEDKERAKLEQYLQLRSLAGK